MPPFLHVILLGLLAFAATPPTPPVDPPPGLDPRIKPDRITESDPPPPALEIVQPLPAVHRIRDHHEPDMALDAERFARARLAIERGLAYLRTQQKPSGGWLLEAQTTVTDQPDRPTPVTLAVSALALKALAQAAPRETDGTVPADAAIDAALRFLLAGRGEAGWAAGEPAATYVNACIAMGLASVPSTSTREGLEQALATLREGQWDQGEGLAARQDWYGGAGYGRNGRPDLSNTQFMLDALHDAGVSPDDPAVQRALVFVSRTQNLKATNSASWAQQGSSDGGFVYTPANGGESFASEEAGEGRFGERITDAPRSLRSYGSMTYAGFKSLLYAGLDRDDPRVRAAFDWIRRHFTFAENPGMGSQGLFYYYHAMARALVAAQQAEIAPLERRVDDAGNATLVEAAPINWRAALVDALLARQRPDGSWVNDATRWMEGEPVLVTAYAVLALQETLK